MGIKLPSNLTRALLFGIGRWDPRPTLPAVLGTEPVLVGEMIVFVSRRPIPVRSLPTGYVVPVGCLVRCGECDSWFVWSTSIVECSGHE